MRFMTTLLMATAIALPAIAKPAHPPMHKAKHHMAARTGTPGNATVNDKGPFTPEANRAYNGGGAILEGQPGGPPPPASDIIAQPPKSTP